MHLHAGRFVGSRNWVSPVHLSRPTPDEIQLCISNSIVYRLRRICISERREVEMSRRSACLLIFLRLYLFYSLFGLAAGPGPSTETLHSPRLDLASPLSTLSLVFSSRLIKAKKSTMTLPRGHSCIVCQQRRVRCDLQKPCANCVRAQLECKVAPLQPPKKRRKNRERELLERLKEYESLMTRNGVSFDSVFDNHEEFAGRQGESSPEKPSPGDSILNQTPRVEDHGRRLAN